MANHVRSAKPGSDWTRYELTAYNITIVSLPPSKFFPTPDPPLDHIDPDILDCSDYTNLLPESSKDATRFLQYYYLASIPPRGGSVSEFSACTLNLLAFDDWGRTVAIPGNSLPLTICGKINFITQLCLITLCPTFVLLTLVVDKAPDGVGSAAQAIAGAIAAFQFNNAKRMEHGLKPLDVMTIPCITMTDIIPTFYLVPVTTALSDAVISGTFPATRTEVLECSTVATHVNYEGVGAQDTEYRKLILKRFLAFKALAKTHWEHISDGV